MRVCVCVCVCTDMDFSAEDKTITASHFARRFIGVQGRASPIFVNFAPLKPKIVRIGQRAGHAHPHVTITIEMC